LEAILIQDGEGWSGKIECNVGLKKSVKTMPEIQNNNRRTDSVGLKSYISPKLEIFGDISALTAAGSVNKKENRGHPNGMG
jgi:hypothetical protein